MIGSKNIEYKNERYPRGAAVSACKDGRILVIGGENPPIQVENDTTLENSQNNSENVVFSTNRCILLSQHHEKVRETSKMNFPRMYHTAETIEQKTYVIGGVTGSIGTPVQEIEIYDQMKKTWTVSAKMITPRSKACSVNMNGRIYVIGGVDKNGNSLSTIEYFDVYKNKFFSVYTQITPKNPKPDAAVTIMNTKNILARGLTNATASKIGWNKFIITGGSYSSTLIDTNTGENKIELNNTVLTI